MSKHLTLQELQRIYMLRENGFGIRKTARAVKRNASTVSRELKRAKPRKFWKWGCWSKARYSYEQRQRVRSLSRARLKLKSASLRHYVIEKLELGFSPELISLRLKHLNSDESISSQAIYDWIHTDCPEFKKYLVRKGKRGTRGGKRNKKVFRNANKRSIHQRDVIVNSRARFGDWEADTVVSSKSKACVFTLRERKSRYVRFIKLDACTALNAYSATIQSLQELPLELLNTITYDNGGENSLFERLEKRLNILCYFCDPYASWQRGAVENANGLLRRHYPKGTDFRNVTQGQLTNIENIYNNRPMKCLDGRTPSEVFFEQLENKIAA